MQALPYMFENTTIQEGVHKAKNIKNGDALKQYNKMGKTYDHIDEIVA